MLPNTLVASPRVCCYLMPLHPPLCFSPSLIHLTSYPGQGPPAGRRVQVGPIRAWPGEQPSCGPSVPHRAPLTSSPLNLLSPCSQAFSQLAAFSRFTRNQMQRADWAIHTDKKKDSQENVQCPLTWYWNQYWCRLGTLMLSPDSKVPQVPAESSWRLPRRSCCEEDQDFAAHTTEASGNQEAGRF